MLSNDIVSYLQKLRPAPDEDIEEMEQYAYRHRIPIMDPVSVEVLLFILKLIRPRRILEIGTGDRLFGDPDGKGAAGRAHCDDRKRPGAV